MIEQIDFDLFESRDIRDIYIEKIKQLEETCLWHTKSRHEEKRLMKELFGIFELKQSVIAKLGDKKAIKARYDEIVKDLKLDQ